MTQSKRLYLRYVNDDTSGYLERWASPDNMEFCKDIEGALDLSDLDEKKLLEVVCDAKENYCENDDLSFVEVVERPIDLGLEYQEVVQMVALKKLTSEEVRALGLESTAVYIKLRHHKTENVS